MTRRVRFALAALFVVVPAGLLAGAITIPNAFSNNTVADATAVNANFAAVRVGVNDNASRIATLEAATQTHFYSGRFPTPQEWEADLLMNGNYARFCQQLGKTFVSATTVIEHWATNADRGGYFYAGWYYNGPKFCGTDTFHAGNSGNEYSSWKYNGGCGCCISTPGWTFERRAFITCR